MKRSRLKVGDIVMIGRPPGKRGQSRVFHAAVSALPDAKYRIPTQRVMNAVTGRLADSYTMVTDDEILGIVRRDGIPFTKGARNG